jgi:hypothetical protein
LSRASAARSRPRPPRRPKRQPPLLTNQPTDDAGADRRGRYGMERVRRTAPRRLRELCRVLFSRAQPAHPLGDELACRGHGWEAGGGARGPDLPADGLRAAAPFEVACGVGLVSGLVPGPRPERPGPVRQLCAGPRGQTRARLPAHRHCRLVPEAVSDAAVAATSGGARIRDDGARLSHRHLGRRGADRAGCRHHHHRRPAEARGGAVAGATPGSQRVVRPPFTAASTTSYRGRSC